MTRTDPHIWAKSPKTALSDPCVTIQPMDIIIRTARPEELAAVGDLTARAYEAVLPDGDAYLEHLRNAAHRAQHTELLIAANPVGDILGSVAFVAPGSVYTELAREGEG